MYWFTMLGVALIATGTFLIYFGQDIISRMDDSHIQQSISEKNIRIDELVSGNNELITRVDEYQKNLSEKDVIIRRLEARIDRQNMPASELNADIHAEADKHVAPETDINALIKQAKSFHAGGEYEKAYKIAEELRNRNPELGEPYFILGTIEISRKHYEEGTDLLDRAIRLGLPGDDQALAFHSLGVASLFKKEFENARGFFERSIKLNSSMEKSRNALKLLDNYLWKKKITEQVKDLYKEGRYEEAYKAADDLRGKHPDFSLSYFILGTIELHREEYDKGEWFLNKAIDLGLPVEDLAWAYHNLGISSLRRKDFKQAREFIEKALQVNPDMEESRETLDLINEMQREEEQGKE